jgi:uncharacterized low-complexity protein
MEIVSMTKQRNLKPVAIAVGAALTAGMTSVPVANAEENPFAMTKLSSGYMVADHDKGEGKCGEGKCGEGKKEKEGEGKCGEGKCGGK